MSLAEHPGLGAAESRKILAFRAVMQRIVGRVAEATVQDAMDAVLEARATRCARGRTVERSKFERWFSTFPQVIEYKKHLEKGDSEDSSLSARPRRVSCSWRQVCERRVRPGCGAQGCCSGCGRWRRGGRSGARRRRAASYRAGATRCFSFSRTTRWTSPIPR